MALQGYRAFVPEEVRFVKENLLRGVTITALARHFGVSTETISKIKRGITYTSVVVEGEERLRPETGLGERAKRLTETPLAPRGKTEEEIEAAAAESEQRLLESLGLTAEGLVKEE